MKAPVFNSFDFKMPTRSPVREPIVKRQHDVSEGREPRRGRFRPKAFEVLTEEQTFWQKTVDQFNGNEGAGYAISFVVHAVLLVLLAIPVFNSFEADEGFTTLIDNPANDQVTFDAPLDTLIASPEEASSSEKFETKLFDPTSSYDQSIPQLKVATDTSVKSDGDGTGADGTFGGGRIAEPENAIKVGSFSVWPWPILSGRRPLNGEIRHGTPGEAPKARQDYSIVIRIKVPDNKKFVRLSDYSGSVVGTDGYTQEIPRDAFYFRANGQLVKARASHRMPVIDGTAEILIRVPGAAFSEIKDTIKVYSRILDEEQKIELVFQARK